MMLSFPCRQIALSNIVGLLDGIICLGILADGAVEVVVTRYWAKY